VALDFFINNDVWSTLFSHFLTSIYSLRRSVHSLQVIMVVVSLSSSEGSSGRDSRNLKDGGLASTFSLTLLEIEGLLGRDSIGLSSTNVHRINREEVGGSSGQSGGNTEVLAGEIAMTLTVKIGVNSRSTLLMKGIGLTFPRSLATSGRPMNLERISLGSDGGMT